MRRAILGLLAGVLLSGAAWAGELRAFPAGTVWAQFRGYDGDVVVLGDPRPSLSILLSTLGLGGSLDGRTDVLTQQVSFKLAPGIQVRDQRNFIVPVASLRDTGKTLVRFRTDVYGSLWHMWLLTPEEAARF